MPESLFGWVIDLFVSLAGWLWATITLVWSWLWAGIVVILWAVAQFLIERLPSGVADFLNAQPWDEWMSYYELVAWWFPVGGTLAIVFSVIGMIGVIRTARWVFALIPTLGG